MLVTKSLEPCEPFNMDDTNYWPYYCEENAWHRCRAATGSAWALFISNATKTVAMCAQGSGTGPLHMLVWDYHVLAIHAHPDGARAIDLDHVHGETTLLRDYLAHSFDPLDDVRIDYQARFKLVLGADYVRDFASDRRHMRAADGGWLQAPPPWPPIGTGFNLTAYANMESHTNGPVFDRQGLQDQFSL
jgi:protein N-terminal glutamine amidohydrolase